MGKKQKKTEPTGKPAAAPTAPPPRPIAEIEAEIQKLQEKLDGMSPWQNEKKYAELQEKIAQLIGESGVAKASAIVAAKREIPDPSPRVIPISRIVAGANHRDPAAADQAKVIELARSMQSLGQLEPIAVQAMASDGFQLVFGFTRLAAARLNGWTEIAAMVYGEDVSPAQLEVVRAAENVQRRDLNYLEEAAAVAAMRDRLDTHGFVVGEAEEISTVASRLGKSETWVRDRMYLARLAEPVRKLVTSGRLNLKQAREIAKIADPDAQESLARQACFSEEGTGGWSPDRLRRQVNEQMYSLKSVPWKLDVAFGKYPNGRPAPACVNCTYNTANDRNLFEHDPAGAAAAAEAQAGLCTCPGCFDGKRKITEQAISKDATKAAAAVKKNPSCSAMDAARMYQPEIVREATFERQVQKAVRPDAVKPAAKKSTTPGRYEKSPEENAKSKLREARWKLDLDVCKHIAKLAGANVLTAAYWYLFDTAVQNSDPETLIAKPWAQEFFRVLRGGVVGIDDMERLATVGKIKPDPDVYIDFEGESLAAFAAAAGMNITMPKLEDFLPKKEPVTSTKPGEVTTIKKGADGKTVVTKKSAKKTAKPKWMKASSADPAEDPFEPWIQEVMTLGPVNREDPFWTDNFQAGVSPQNAVAVARAKGNLVGWNLSAKPKSKSGGAKPKAPSPSR